MNTDPTKAPAVAGPVELPVRPAVWLVRRTDWPDEQWHAMVADSAPTWASDAVRYVPDERVSAERERLREVLQACQRHLACNAVTNELQELYQRVRAEVERA